MTGAIRVAPYEPGMAGIWNGFVAQAKAGLFLFDRRYMDYHADRFVDHSLMFYDGDKLVGLLPASERDGVVTSHGGLTFGGVLSDRRLSTGHMLQVFEELRAYLATAGLSKLIYKAIPHIYHQVPAEEDLYALFIQGARLVRRDVSATIDLRDQLAYGRGRKGHIAKAIRNDLDISECRDFRAFMALKEIQLMKKFGVKPTHTGEEMELLASRFPLNIRLFTARKSEQLLGGILVYESAMVVHAQYICASDAGLELGALDAILHRLLIETYPATHRYFDFGISTEQGGRYLNTGLMDNKESYGARATVHDFYELYVA